MSVPTVNPDTLTKPSRLSDLTGIIPLSSLLTGGVILLFIYWFLNHQMYAFYASILFGFYALTQRMWISVILLGAFQTLILVPLRVRRLHKKIQIEEMAENIQSLPEGIQRQKVKESFSLGDRAFLFYLLDFTIQLTTFLTIGRLFLTDFYQQKLAPTLLYEFIPYPEYPIRDTIFKIPYPYATQTLELQGVRFAGVFLGIFAILVGGRMLYSFIKKKLRQSTHQHSKMFSKYSFGYLIIMFLFAWFLTTHIPIGIGLGIFKGDVSKQNSTLNLITAVVTFLTLVWFGVNKIWREEKEQRASGWSEAHIEQHSQKAFTASVKNSALVGAGAFFVTNHIPSAFELSVFTLELISLLSPLTLDRLILGMSRIGQRTPVPEAPVAAPVPVSQT